MFLLQFTIALNLYTYKKFTAGIIFKKSKNNWFIWNQNDVKRIYKNHISISYIKKKYSRIGML